eukprot:1133375-Pelagomonas_calceolata.AAC.1
MEPSLMPPHTPSLKSLRKPLNRGTQGFAHSSKDTSSLMQSLLMTFKIPAKLLRKKLLVASMGEHMLGKGQEQVCMQLYQ